MFIIIKVKDGIAACDATAVEARLTNADQRRAISYVRAYAIAIVYRVVSARA